MDRWLLTGGSGTLGRAMLLVARREAWPVKFTIFARSESRLARLKRTFPEVTCVIGDVRDKHAVEAAVAGHNVVIHMAALKRIPECEEHPREAIHTNVLGTENVLCACTRSSVEKCVVISTDKACNAFTTYGATKLLLETLLVSYAENFPQVSFLGVRYGNVLASEGSVLQLWEACDQSQQPLPLTDPHMSRFWMSPYDAISLIQECLRMNYSGGILVPKVKALPIVGMARYLYPEAVLTISGLRSNEKMHEDLLHPLEFVEDIGNHFLIRSRKRMGNGTIGWTYRSNEVPLVTSEELHQMLRDAREVEGSFT